MLIHDPATVKLGRPKVRHDARTLKLADYLPTLPPAPPSVSYSASVKDWGMMLNDRYGDCTCAGWGHLKLLRSTLGGTAVRMTDQQVEQLYIDVTGLEGAAFDPATDANDNGCVELDVLNLLRKQAEVGAYASVNPKHQDAVRFTIFGFEGVYMGCGLPISAQSQTVWDVPAGQALTGDFEPGSWGGHCMIAVDYDADGVSFVTWGGTKKATWAWWDAYVDEAYAILSPDLVNGTKPAPSGFALDQLTADIQALG